MIKTLETCYCLYFSSMWQHTRPYHCRLICFGNNTRLFPVKCYSVKSNTALFSSIRYHSLCKHLSINITSEIIFYQLFIFVIIHIHYIRPVSKPKIGTHCNNLCPALFKFGKQSSSSNGSIWYQLPSRRINWIRAHLWHMFIFIMEMAIVKLSLASRLFWRKVKMLFNQIAGRSFPA